MNGFRLNSNGDVVISEGKIEMASDTELLAQTVRQVLKTNLGEWWLNKNEGIDLSCLLCKNPNYEQIEDNIVLGLRQVDETFKLISFNCTEENRVLKVNFTAANENGETIEIEL